MEDEVYVPIRHLACDGEDRGTVIQSVLVGDGQQVTAPAECFDPAAGLQPHHVHGGRAATASTAPHTRG